MERAELGKRSPLSICRGDWIRTSDLFVPNEARYRAALRPEKQVANLGITFLTGKPRQKISSLFITILILAKINYMIRKYFHKIKNSEKDKIKWRSHEVSRIEAFSDAVIAFAVSLLVVSLEVPKTSVELLNMMEGFAPFSVCFAGIATMWYRQYIFFRRYGMHDRLTISLNICLLFFMLIFVYPLKFIFSYMMLPEIYILKPEHYAPLLVFYTGGIGLISFLFALMYLNAWCKKEELSLTPVEVFETVDSIILAGLPALCCIAAAIYIFCQRHNSLEHIASGLYVWFVILLVTPYIKQRRKKLFKKKFGNVPMVQPQHGTVA
jgi:uncharacterized membrane protein